MKTVSIANFVETFKDYPLTRFGSVQTRKVEETLKKNRVTGEPVPAGCVTSTCRYNPAIGADYQQAVNNRREREGNDPTFKSASLPYGEWVGNGGTIIKSDTTGFQLRLTLTSANTPKKQWYFNGEPVERDTIADILPPVKKVYADKQGLENPILVCNVRLTTVTHLKIDGEDYELCQ